MNIALSQLNVTVGNILLNKHKIIDYIEKAADGGADLVVFGELVVSGTPLYDLVNVSGFLEECRNALTEIARSTLKVDVILGIPRMERGRILNAAVYLSKGEVRRSIGKNHLNLRDELGFFAAEEYSVLHNVIDSHGKRMLVVVGEDINDIHTLSCFDRLDTKPELIIHVSARNFYKEGIRREKEELKTIARKLQTSLISVNLVGGNTDVVFYGGSLVIDRNGCVIGHLAEFEEDLQVIHFGENHIGKSRETENAEKGIEEIYKAVSLGLKDYCRKAGFHSVCLGLSGGIDSAVVASIAAEVMGARNVHALMMPSQFSSDHSIYDAVELSLNLGIKSEKIGIEPMYHVFLKALQPVFENQPFSVVEENIQARIRCVLLMALANKSNSLLLNTSNKSESAVGYGTLYGDDIGGLSILGDLYKTDVYALAGYINREKNLIPEHIINKSPSAELAPGQKDSDILPPYELLDSILYQLIEEHKSLHEIVEKGLEENLVKRVMQMLGRAEYKRYQFCPTLRMSACPLGQGRIMPIVNGFESND